MKAIVNNENKQGGESWGESPMELELLDVIANGRRFYWEKVLI